MTFKEMHAFKQDSPLMKLVYAATPEATALVVDDTAGVADGSGLTTNTLLVARGIINGVEVMEYILCTSRSLASGTGNLYVRRGMYGTTAQHWIQDTEICAVITSYQQNAIVDNIKNVSIIDAYNASQAVLAGKLVCLSSAGTWHLANTTDLEDHDHIHGIALHNADSGNTLAVQITGAYTRSDWNWTPGQVLFASNIDGELSSEPIGRRKHIGFVISAKTVYINGVMTALPDAPTLDDISPLSAPGDIMVYAQSNGALPLGPAGYILASDAGNAGNSFKLAWAPAGVSIANTSAALANVVPPENAFVYEKDTKMLKIGDGTTETKDLEGVEMGGMDAFEAALLFG